MADSYAGFVVSLDNNVRAEDVAPILNAIRHIRGVINVEAVEADAMIHIAQARAERAIEKRIWAALYPDKN